MTSTPNTPDGEPRYGQENQHQDNPGPADHDATQPQTPQEPVQDSGQSEYGVRLTGDELDEWHRTYGSNGQSASRNQADSNPSEYGTPPSAPGSWDQPTPPPYGSEYGVAPQQPQNPWQQPGPYGYPQHGGYPPQGGQSGYYQPPMQPGLPPQGFPAPSDPNQTMKPPTSINLAKIFTWVAGGLFTLFTLFTAFLMHPDRVPYEIINEIQAEMADLEELGFTIGDVLGIVRVTIIVFAVIGLASYILIGIGIGRGSNVARIFGTVLAALSLFSIFSLNIVWVGFGVAAIVLSYTPTANEYIRFKAWEKKFKAVTFAPMPPQQPGNPDNPNNF